MTDPRTALPASVGAWLTTGDPAADMATLRASVAAWRQAIESGELEATSTERAYLTGAADMFDVLTTGQLPAG